MATVDPLLQLESLSVHFSGAEAIRNVSLDVGVGEVVTLLGANGAGKSTTLRTISGLHRPSAGTIRFRGHDLTSMRAHRIACLGIAHVPEGRRLFGQMTARENLEVGLFRRWPARDSDLEPALEMFPELTTLLDRRAYSLSGGEQQMVAIARALLPDPDIVMLDEPSLGLAPVIIDKIIEIVHQLRARGKGVLLVEQNTTVALLCADRGYVLANGKVVFQATSDELTNSSELSNAYIGKGFSDGDG